MLAGDVSGVYGGQAIIHRGGSGFRRSFVQPTTSIVSFCFLVLGNIYQQVLLPCCVSSVCLSGGEWSWSAVIIDDGARPSRFKTTL